MPQVSVIVPVYKVEPYLRECIDSILNQTFKDFELILVDDGSPDNCPAICDEYIEKDNRVIVIHKENGGLSSARNAGLEYAFANSNSEYISFIDSDDYVDFDYLKELATTIGNADLSACYFLRFYESNFHITLFESKLITDNIGYWDIPESHAGIRDVAYCKLYRKELFNLRFEVGALYEDGLIMYKIINRCQSISFLPKCLYFYRVRNDSIMGSSDLKDRDNEIEGLLRQIDKTEFYMNSSTELFLSNYKVCLSTLVRLYYHYPFKSRKSFVKLKNIYKHYCKNNLRKSTLGEKILFKVPFLYCLFYRLRKCFISS